MIAVRRMKQSGNRQKLQRRNLRVDHLGDREFAVAVVPEGRHKARPL